MAWNEPGGGKDPWGGNRNNDGPPDLDEALNALKKSSAALVVVLVAALMAAMEKACCQLFLVFWLFCGA